jgi:DNA-binding Lrp family transcriptional regulator
MISAFTLVRVAREKNMQVFKEIRGLPLVEEATLVYGEYDLIVKTKTENVEELNKFIYNVLRKTSSITMTTTMIVAKIPAKKQISSST